MPTYSIQVSQRGAGGIDTVSTFPTLGRTEKDAIAYQKRLFPRATVTSLGEVEMTMLQMVRQTFGKDRNKQVVV